MPHSYGHNLFGPPMHFQEAAYWDIFGWLAISKLIDPRNLQFHHKVLIQMPFPSVSPIDYCSCRTFLCNAHLSISDQLVMFCLHLIFVVFVFILIYLLNFLPMVVLFAITLCQVQICIWKYRKAVTHAHTLIRFRFDYVRVIN